MSVLKFTKEPESNPAMDTRRVIIGFVATAALKLELTCGQIDEPLRAMSDHDLDALYAVVEADRLSVDPGTRVGSFIGALVSDEVERRCRMKGMPTPWEQVIDDEYEAMAAAANDHSDGPGAA